MRQIVGQVLATTEVDSHGDQLSRDELYSYFEQTEDPSPVYFDHDTSKPPVARLYNKRFEQLPTGAWAIKADIEVLDEERFRQGGGISISYTSGRALGAGPDAPDVTVLIDPQAFGSIEKYRDLLDCSGPELTVAVAELKRKTAGEVAIMVVTFAGVSIAGGFFGQVGADAYKRLKRVLVEKSGDLEKAAGRVTAHHVKFPMDIGGRSATVTIEFPPGQLQAIDAPTVDLEDAQQFIRGVVGDSELREVSVSFSPEPPHWRVEFFIDDDGNVVRV